ncbi:MAG: GTP-binding protein [Alphaproteobacteria bacterium]|nr:GTP-binding protein [Alphaproteobacteria bacterium]
MIPVSVITGFLGSGKTTLLHAVLRDPAYAGSAVIVNEWGDIGLDHELLETTEENLLGLANGCLCCATRGDLARTLIDLAARQKSGAVTYHRVLIETSGLADPAPILHTLLMDPTIAEAHRVEAVVTVVDALLGAETIARHPEAAQQARLADRLLLTKTDLVPDTTALEATLTSVNPGAPILRAVQGAIPPNMLFAAAARPEALRHWLDATATPSARHSAGVETISILREAPLPAVVLPLFLEALAEHAGEKLLRMKGIIRVAEAPDKPAVLHGVRHVLHPIQWLEDWPSTDRRSRLVLIGQGIPQWWPARLLEALEEDAQG